MMRKEDVDRYAARRPFEPFEIRLSDGRRYRIARLETFVVGRTTLVALRRDGELDLISLGAITSIGPSGGPGRRRPRRT